METVYLFFVTNYKDTCLITSIHWTNQYWGTGLLECALITPFCRIYPGHMSLGGCRSNLIVLEVQTIQTPAPHTYPQGHIECLLPQNGTENTYHIYVGTVHIQKHMPVYLATSRQIWV